MLYGIYFESEKISFEINDTENCVNIGNACSGFDEFIENI